MMSSSNKQSHERYVITVGALLRGHVKDTIHDMAFAHDVNLDVTEDKRWFSSRLHIRASGSPARVALFDRWMLQFLHSYHM